MPSGIYQHKIGRKFSEEARKKISLSNRGKHNFKHTDEAKRKIGLASIGNKHNLGRKLTKEHKRKISDFHKGKQWSLGRKQSEEFKQIKRKAFSGENNPRWKGGITPKNRKLRETIAYKLWRIQIFERDKFLCQMPDCDKVERFLNAHHIKKFSDYPKLRFDINNGITLCKKCHNKTKGGKENKYETLFFNIINLNV